MEISDSSKPIFLIGRILGLAPYSVRKNPKGVYIIERSVALMIYSSAFVSLIVFLVYRGLLYDGNANVRVKKFSSTSKVVRALDCSVVVAAVTAGYLCGLASLEASQLLNHKLRKVDEILSTFKTVKWERLKRTALFGIPNLGLLSILIYESLTSLDTTEIIINWMLPFYCDYFMLTILVILFANTAIDLARRFKFLNNMLTDLFLRAEHLRDIPENLNTAAATFKIVKTAKQDSSNKKTLQGSLAKVASENSQSYTKNHVLQMKLIAECHESLGKCIKIVSSAYGLAVLFILISCFLHLIATFYFSVIRILSTEDNSNALLKGLFIIFHACRLLLVVEPCNRISIESTDTIAIVSEMERVVHDPVLAEEVHKLWQQLLVFNPNFSACGLCVVNRSLLTSMCSAIITYLVILIQFQSNNG